MNQTDHNRSLRTFGFAGFGALVLAAALTAAVPNPETPAAEPFSPNDVALFIDQYCATCHNDVDTEGDLDITALKFTPTDSKNLEMWVKIYEQTKSGEMPPKEKRPPRESAKKEFLELVGAALTAAGAKI